MKNLSLTLNDLGIRTPWKMKIKRRWNAFLIFLRVRKKERKPFMLTVSAGIEDETLWIRRNVVTQESSAPGVRAEPRTTTFYG